MINTISTILEVIFIFLGTIFACSDNIELATFYFVMYIAMRGVNNA